MQYRICLVVMFCSPLVAQAFGFTSSPLTLAVSRGCTLERTHPLAFRRSNSLQCARRTSTNIAMLMNRATSRTLVSESVLDKWVDEVWRAGDGYERGRGHIAGFERDREQEEAGCLNRALIEP